MNSGDIGKRSDTGPQEAFDTKFDTKFDEEFDVVVVGYGFAGGVAAIEAHDAGARVLILEKMPVAGVMGLSLIHISEPTRPY